MEDNYTDIDLVLITKYLNAEADEKEISQVNEWITASDGNKSEYEKLLKAWELATAGIGMVEWDAKKSKEQFLLKVIEAQSNSIHRIGGPNGISRKFVHSMLKYAAIGIILIGISSFFYYYKKTNYQLSAMMGKSYTQISAARGSKTLMMLADGSKVWLNAGSSIKYSTDFNKKEREIFLEGEAYFEVAKNKDKPFSVNAGGIIVHATGTIFNVKAYPEEKVVETTLVEGSVIVEVKDKPSDRTTLKPKEQVYYYKPVVQKNKEEKDKILISKGIEPELYTSWINDQLAISNETLESLTVKLGRKYDVVFHFEDPSLEELRFTGVLKNETIEQILEVLKISSPVNYRIDERDIYLTRK